MATRQRELTLLVVGPDGARLAGLRLEYTGETTCAASADDLTALLDRRAADALVFLSHGDLAAPVLDYLKRRGKPPPASVIALGNGLGDSNPEMAATLRRLADADDPGDLLARLFEALASAHLPPGPLALPQPQEPCVEPEDSTSDALTPRQDARARRLQVVLERSLARSSETQTVEG